MPLHGKDIKSMIIRLFVAIQLALRRLEGSYDGEGSCCSLRCSPDSPGASECPRSRPCAGPGEFNVPHSMVVDVGGLLCVAERSNQRVQVFDGYGVFLRVSAKEEIYVADALDWRVQKLVRK